MTPVYPALALLQSAPGTWFAPIFMYGAIFAIFYFVLIRPGQKQRRAQDEMMRGDEIVTNGGVIGTVIQIPAVAEGSNPMEDRLTIKSGESRLIVERGRIARVIRGTSASSEG